MSGNRKDKRIYKRIGCNFGESDLNHRGHIKNISFNGIAIAAKKIFKPSTQLDIQIDSESGPINVKGVVRWASNVDSDAITPNTNLDMGVQLFDRPGKYADFIEEIEDVFSETRYEQRFEKIFKVSYETPKMHSDEFTQNISMGGMFIMAENPLAIDSFVDVQLYLTDIKKSVRVEARVVHVVTREMAKEEGFTSGIGVQFSKFHEKDEQLLSEYICMLKAKFEEE